jgi:4-amino-4-deoxy-L-arabinose transferase-like glycosyltransferase
MQTFLHKHKYLLVLLFSYLILRLINLTIIPIFNDEAIYLDWGWKSFHGSNVFNSLGDGKQPFVTWLFGIAEGLLADPLFAGRAVSVLAGFVTLLGLYRIGKEVFNEKVGTISALLYILIPLFSFFDRQALMESAVAATEVWTVYLFLKLLKAHSLKIAMLLGVVVGIGFFIKSTILLLLLAMICAYLFVVRFRQKNKLLLWDGGIALIISQLVLLPLYLQPLFWQTLSMNNRYSMGISELIRFPVVAWLTNLWVLLQISFWHLTPLVWIAAIAGMYLLMKRPKTKTQLLILWTFLLQTMLFILVAKGINPRYTMPILPLTLLFAAFFITYFAKWSNILIVALVLMPLYFLCLQLFQPYQYFTQLQALTPYSQKNEYITGSTAGYAVSQAIQYIISTHVDKAAVAVRLDAGNPENAIFTYFHNSHTRRANYLASIMIANVANYQCLTYRFPVYFVSRDYQLAGLDRFLQQEKRFYNPEQRSSVGVYHFRYPCNGNTLNLSAPGAILPPPNQ